MSEFNPSSRKKQKKKEEPVPDKPSASIKKETSGEERRRRFSRTFEKLVSHPFRIFIRKTLGIQDIFLACLFYFSISLYGLFLVFFPILLLLYILCLLLINLVFRYFYPERFKKKE